MPGCWGERDEVRRLVIPRALRGYDSAAVDELLDRVAAELDAGRPVAPLIEAAMFPQQTATFGQQLKGERSYPVFGTGAGYECADVDGMLSQLRRQDDPAARTDPWRDLPAWRYSIAGPDADGGSLSASARRGAAPRAVWKRAVQDYTLACADAWRDFGLLPGTQLCLVKAGGGRELRAGGQSALVLAKTRYSRSFSRAGRTYTLGRVKAAQWPTIATEISAGPPSWRADMQRKAAGQDPAGRKPMGLKSLAGRTGEPVLYTRIDPIDSRHQHRDLQAGGYVQFPGQRWLQFPVRGTKRSNAIMTAVDQAGRQVARYRIASGRALTKWRTIEITVHPDQQLTDELILTLALTAPWISSFFQSSGGGGG